MRRSSFFGHVHHTRCVRKSLPTHIEKPGRKGAGESTPINVRPRLAIHCRLASGKMDIKRLPRPRRIEPEQNGWCTLAQ